MKYLQKYKLFENLQQAENYIAKNNLDPTYFEKLKEITKQKGLLYLLTIILYSSDNQQKELEKIENYLDKISQSNIKIDTNQITPDIFYQYVDNQISKTNANKYNI